MAAIRLIMQVDSVVPPLTGIGRYTYEVLRRVQQHADVAQVKYFSLGRWVADPCAALQAERVAGAVTAQASLRERLAGNRLAVGLYARVAPHIFRWRLRGEGNAVFHGPNFFVPRFPGPAVATVHDLSYLVCPQFHPAARVHYMRKAMPESLRQTDIVITDSEAVRTELMERLAWPADRVVAIGLGVGAEFSPREPEELAAALAGVGLKPGAYALFVGTVEPRKNLDRLLSAYGALPGAVKEAWPLVVAGGRGWQSEPTHAQLQRAEAEGWARYLRFVPQALLPALYAGARLFAYPSLYEGFGLPIAEAMACGCPVITSNVSSMPEVAGGAARLVHPLDVDELRHALAQALTDDAWLQSARAAGLVQARRFSWDHCAAKTVDVYRQLSH